MENKKDNNLGKIILLLAPPIASGLHLHSKENVWFFSTQKLKKTLLQKKIIV
ncbi:hypothetical protein GvMRE_IIg291 [endosymbiont GvMRE of Glomus versiforme]|nr:hypothetical protein GvMRE_IIg291 [endosymbiont GvMRE of Glomus versiforme]